MDNRKRPMIKKIGIEKLKEDRGMTAALTALLLPVLIALTGLILDAGILIYERVKLEEATTIAAISTIAAYDVDIWDDDGEVVLDPYEAELYAYSFLIENMPDAQLMSCVVDPLKPSSATVTTQKDVQLIFMKFFGLNQKTIKTTVIGHGK